MVGQGRDGRSGKVGRRDSEWEEGRVRKSEDSIASLSSAASDISVIGGRQRRIKEHEDSSVTRSAPQWLPSLLISDTNISPLELHCAYHAAVRRGCRGEDTEERRERRGQGEERPSR
jgi:hypothetical protein